MYEIMNATVKGITEDGDAFETSIKFSMIPPKKDSKYYGNGYYMSVKMPSSSAYVDVRYENTTDVEILADRWIDSYFGKNSREVIKQFPVDGD